MVLECKLGLWLLDVQMAYLTSEISKCLGLELE